MRILTYNSSARGAGQYVRSLKLARIVVDSSCEAQVVILAGNSVVERQVPARTEIVALPQVWKTAQGAYVANSSGRPAPQNQCRDLSETFALRRQIIRSTLENFQPDLFLVDSRPLGLNGELAEFLELRSLVPRCRNVLALRDIVDEPRLVTERWSSDGTYTFISNHYDKVVVFGEEGAFDAVAHYELSEARQKIRYLGFLGSSKPIRAYSVGTQSAPARNTVLVTVGGGYDGAAIIETVCRYINGGSHETQQLRFTIVLGSNSPLSASRLLAQYPLIRRNTVICGHVNNLDDLISEAHVVVSMCGYNTLFELVQRMKKVIGIPRSYTGSEQLLRADVIRHLYDGLWVLPENQLTPDKLERLMGQVMAAPPPNTHLPMTGSTNFVAFLNGELRGAQ